MNWLIFINIGFMKKCLWFVKMRNIILVHCISTGLNFIGDIINRGYTPIVLEMQFSHNEVGEEYIKHIHEGYQRVPYDFDIIYEKDSYEENLESVKKYDPILVLPASEKGVVLATQLANDLDLLSNPIENIGAMTLKDKMQERIAEHGLRSIKGKVVSSLEEAIEFYDSEDLKEVVIKPTYSTGSASVRMCLNKEEMIDTIKLLFDPPRYVFKKVCNTSNTFFPCSVLSTSSTNTTTGVPCSSRIFLNSSSY